MLALDIVSQARALVGVPWRHMGRDPSGLDCLGLAMLAVRGAGVEVPEPPRYPRTPRGTHLLDGLRQVAVRVLPIDRHDEGDLLAFATGRFVAHLGVRSVRYGQPAVIHARAMHGGVVEEVMTHELLAALRSAWRVVPA